MGVDRSIGIARDALNMNQATFISRVENNTHGIRKYLIKIGNAYYFKAGAEGLKAYLEGGKQIVATRKKNSFYKRLATLLNVTVTDIENSDIPKLMKKGGKL